MDSRQQPQIPFARNSAASPPFAHSPFQPGPSGPPPTSSSSSSSSSYPPRPTAATASTSPATVYAEQHHQRRPSDHNTFYSHSQSRPPHPYAAEPTSHPAQAHARHQSSSSAHNAPIHRAMPPPSPPQHPQHPQHQPQQQQPLPPHQMGPYGGPPAPRPPPVNLGPPSNFPSERNLPALHSLARMANASGSMSISSMISGPQPAHRESTPGHGPPYQPPPPTASAVSGPAYTNSVHASPRMQNATEYSPYQHGRRPQTPEPGRQPFDARDRRGSVAGSPSHGVYGTPEVSRYSTPQAYQQRPPPMPSTDDNRREPANRVGNAGVPPRPSSQPRPYHNMASRSAEMGRAPPPPHGDAIYARRDEQHRLAAEREYRDHMNSREARDAREAGYRDQQMRNLRDRERREREMPHFEEHRPFVADRERFGQDQEREREREREIERERENDRDRDREREIEMHMAQRERTASDPTRPPGQHPGDLGPHPTPRPPHYGPPDPRDPRDPHAWQQRPGYDQAQGEMYGQPYAGHRPGEYPVTTGHPYGPHPAYVHQPPEHFPPSSQPPHHGITTSQPGPPPGHPFESPDRLRYAPVQQQQQLQLQQQQQQQQQQQHHHQPQQHPQHPQQHQQHQQHQHQPQQQHQQHQPPRGLLPGGRPAEEGPPPPSVAYNGGPGAAGFEGGRPRPMDDGPTHAGPQRGLLGVQEMNRRGRLSPLPQAVQGAQPMIQGPAGEPGIKSEFGRMFSGIGSGVRGIGVSSPGPSGAPIPFTNANLRRDEIEPQHHEVVTEPPTKPPRKRRKPKDEEGKGDDDSHGRVTPAGRNKRSKAHAHHHHHHHHHHHPHHHGPERTSSPSQGIGNALKNLKSTTPIPSPTSKDYPFTHHHQPPRSNPTSNIKQPPPGPSIVPKPKQRISSQAVLDSVADRPRKHLGDVVYSVLLKPAKLEASHSKFGFSTTPRPLPLDMIKDHENSTLTVKVPRVHLTPVAREEITSRRALWGTDVYTDDSDVVAACIHAGWIRGEWPSDVDIDMLDLQKPVISKSKQRILPAEEHLEVLSSVPVSGPIHVPADRDLHVTLLILPALERYASSTRYGIQSREFGGSYNGRKSIHDGLSYMITSVRWVDGAAPQSRLRGKVRRERIRKAMSEVIRSQIVDIGESEVSNKTQAKDQGTNENGQPIHGNREGNKENHPDAPASAGSIETWPVADKIPDDVGEGMEEEIDVVGNGLQKTDNRPTEDMNEKQKHDGVR